MIRTDDTAPTHSKFLQAGLLAYGWWHAALSFSARQMTDGFIAARSIALVFATATPEQCMQAIEALVRERSLHVVNKGQSPACHNPSKRCPHRRIAPEDGYVLHNYFRFQKPRKKALAAREFKIKAGRKGGEVSAERRKQSATAEAKQPASTVPIRSVPFLSDPKDKDSKKTRSEEFANANGSERPRQPSREEQLAALAQLNGTTTDQLAADARALVARTAASMRTR